MGDLNKILFSQFWGLGNQRWGCWQIWCLAKPCFLVCRQPSPHCIAYGKGRSKLSSPLRRALISFMSIPPLWPIYFPKAPPPNIITLRVRISTYEFGADTNIQSVIYMYINIWNKVWKMHVSYRLNVSPSNSNLALKFYLSGESEMIISF